MAYIARAREEIEKKIEDEGFDKSRIQILSMITRLKTNLLSSIGFY